MQPSAAQSAAASRAGAAGHGRLVAIDVARALAILMMLQGHFVALALAPGFRDLADPAFRMHARLRGLTAPLFLTVSGLVFVSFVGGDRALGWSSPRLRRGLRRGLMLVLLGYVLRLDLAALLSPGGDVFARLAGTHVLHVVGVGLWVLSLACLLCSRLPAGVTCALLAALGGAFFVATGVLRELDLTALPVGLTSYLVPAHGGQFALFPWLGYVCVGGACGACLRGVSRSSRPLVWSLAVLAIAAVLYARATPWVFRLHRACGDGLLCGGLPQVHNYLHRLAPVLALLAVLVCAEPWLRRSAPQWLLHTGRHTLLVFVVHAVVLYGALTGWGLATGLRDRFTPLEAALGAVVFVALHVLLVRLWVGGPGASSGPPPRWADVYSGAMRIYRRPGRG